MSNQFATLNGERIVAGDVCIPMFGLWVADIELATSTAIGVDVVVQVANLSLKGHTFRSASFSGARSARVVGGYGGWRKFIPGQSYSNPSGVRQSMILRDAASLCGEQINVGTDKVLNTTWVRERCKGSEILRLLLGEAWYINEDGVTQAFPRINTSRIKSDFTVGSWSGARGRFDIATEDLASWLPARTFVTPTVTSEQQISMTNIHLDNEGKLRLDILTTGHEDV